MKRFPAATALALGAALFHFGCCGCDDNPTAPVVVATPTPAPTPTPTPAFACTVSGLPDSFRCAAEPPPRFEAVVVAGPGPGAPRAPGDLRVLGQGHLAEIYTGWVAQTLRARGFCAIGGTDDEISIKDSNSSSELYDVVTGGRDTWTNYVFTCRPSLF